MYSYWKRHSGALGRAVLLSLAAGTLFMGSAYAKDYTSPITMDYETDYGDNDVKGDYHDVLTRDNSNPKNPKLTYDFGKDTVVNIRTGGDKGKDDIAPIGHGRYDSEIPMTTTVIRAKTLNLDATTSYNNGSLPYSAAGIYASGGTNLTINGDVNIHVDNRTEDGVDYFVYGIDVPMAADNPSKITINGNLSMKGSGTDASSDDYWGIITKAVHANGGGAKADYQGIRWAPAGLYLQGAHGSYIDVNGDVDLRVKGIGILQDSWGEPTDSAYVNKINLNKGDIYVETPQNDTEGWYSAASYGGTVNINMNEAETAPLSHKVVLIGNVYASHEDGNGYLTTDGTDGKTVKIPNFFTNGKLNIGLNTKDSCWTGIIDNTGAKVSDVVDYQDKTKKNTANTKGSQIGEVNLYLANGAVWNYRALGKKNGNDVATMPSPSLTKYGVYDGISHLTSLTGGSDEKTAGIIKMTETDPIEISRASGTTKIWYDHEGSTPGTMKGGDVKVLNADAGAHMILITGKNGIEKGFAETDGAGDRNKVSEVLNSLAHKLWYTAGNSSLTGTVEIAEGLTSPALKTGTISFSTAETGTKQKGQGYYDYTPAEDTAEYKNGPIMTSENIGETRKADVDGNVDVQVVETQDGPEEVTAVYNSTDAPMVVDLQGKKLHAAAHGNKSKYLETVYVQSNKAITVTDSKGTGKLTISAGIGENGEVDTKTKPSAVNGIGIDSKGTFTSDVNVEISGVKSSGTRGTYGISMSSSDGNSTAIFNKDLTIHNVEDSNKAGASVSGINLDGSTGSGSSSMTVKGKLDIADVAGSAVKVMNGSVLTTSSASVKAAAPTADNTSNQYYAVNAVKGTINLNTGDGITPGKLDVTGDIKLTDDAQSVVNMNLNAASLWKGASIINTTSTYNDPSAQMNLAMEEGSSWTHTTGLSGDTAASEFAGSRISKLSGQGGVVYQDSDKPVTVYDYSGNKTVVYRHDSADPTMIQGGDFIVKKAASGSAITLVTGSEGLKAGFKDTDSAADRNKVSAVLNKLANKLYYSGYAKEKNLTGVVRIAEGLTASSASAAVGKEGEITFSDGTGEGLSAGQGYYAYVPDSEVVYKTGPITDSEKISETRKDEEGTVYVKAVNPNADSEKYVSALYAAGTADKANPMKVRMDGKNLDLNAASADKIAAAVYVTDNAHVEILNNAKDKTLSIHASNTDTRAANGILSKGSYSSLHMEGPVEISNIMTVGDGAAGISVDGQNSEVILDGTLTVKNVSGKREQGRGQNAAGIRVVGDNSSVSVTGPVDLSGIKGSSLRTTGADTEISVGGGTITAAKDEDKSHNYYAARVDKGTININMKDGKAGTNTTKITGDMYVTDQYGKKVVEYTGGALVDCKDAGKLNVALTDKDSFWTGVAAYDQYNDSYGPGGNTMHDIGEFNLYLANGASWTNEQQAHVTTGTLDTEKQVWKGSQLASLHGGSDEAHAGIIYQKHEDPIFVENYSGYERVFYEHEKDDPASIKGGAFKIANAEEGSAITLITDSTGLSSRWKETDDAVSRKQVSDVLNQLAGKLYYGNYKDGHLKGTVEIADGLTVSSKVFKTDDILFYTDSDVTSGAAKEAGWGHVQDKAVPDSSTYKNVPITGNLDADAVPSQKPYVDAGIVRKDGTYKFTSDTVLETTKDYSTMIDARKDVVIDAAGKTLTLRGTIDTPSISTDEHERLALIQSGQGKNLTINAGRLVLDAEQSASGGNTYGMAIDGSVNPTHVTVNGNVDVTSTSKVKSNMGGAYGIWARGRAVIDIHGTVTMKKENGWAVDSDQNGFSFYGSGGILSTSVWGADLNQGATINVDNVDLKVNGNGLWTNIGGGIINVNGGSVEVNPNNGVGYSALLAECGTVNMNVLKDVDGNVTGAGNNDVTIKGNVFAATGAINDVDKGTYTSINLGLTNERSSLTGVIWNGFRDEGNKNTTKLFYGRTNLWLSDGAQWHHEPYGSVEVKDMNYYGDKFKGSVVSNFHGGSSEAHSGYIFQGTPSKKARKLGITFKNYNGYTIVFYNHDETDPTQMIGGDITIEKAAEGSGITLVTDSKGLTAGFSTSDKAADQNKVSEVLNKLAQKLFYTANDGHLAGTVKIADGLTASSKSLKSGAISFSSDSTGTKVKGQGFYEYEPASDDVLTDPITGGMDKKYVNIGVEKTKGHYDFAEDSTITVTAGQYASLIGTVDAVNGPVTINGKGTTLSLINDQKGSNVARAVSTGLYKGNDVSITADRLNLDARTSGFRAQGIYADKGTVYVNADTHISTKASSDSRGIYAGGSSVIHMNGGLSNDVDTTAASYSALYADGNGRITVNMKDGKAGGGKVNLKGDIYTESITSEDDYYDESSENSTVDMALSGKESSWHGRSVYSTSTSGDDSSKGYGDFNLILDDGAVWTNEKVGSGMDAGSHVTKLTGGAEGKSGIIVQKDRKDLTVDALSGHTEVRYEKLDGTGSLRIHKAEVGTSVVLAAVSDTKINTASHLAADYNKTGVGSALNALAQKLYYTGRDNKLAGTVELVSAFGGTAVVSGTISYKPDGQGFYDYADAIDTITGIRKNNMNYVVSGILRDDGENYVFSGDDSVSVKDGNAVSIDGNTGHKVNVRDEGHTLALSSGTSKEQGSSIAVSVNGGEAEITAKTLQVTAAGGNRREGIHAASGDASTPARLTVNGNLDITASDVNNQKKVTSIGIYAAGNADVVVNGNVNMKKDNLWAVSGKGSGFYSASGLYATSNMGTNSMGSSITVNGDTVMKVDGNGVFANAGGSIVTLNGRTDIEVNKDTNLGYAALRAEDGTINVNVNRDAKGAVTGAGTHDVVIKGNVAAETGAVNSVDKRGTLTQVNLGLSTAGSSLTGTIYNGFPSEGKTEGSLTFKGETNLWLANGAVWNNEEYGKVINAWGGKAYTGSRVTNFYGKGGFILQNDKNPIAVDHYSGDTTVIYRHEVTDDSRRENAELYGNKAVTVSGGKFRITKADPHSSITLVTDASGLNMGSRVYTDKNLVNDALDKLANQLVYAGYEDKDLTGTVRIAEGLTSPSISKALVEEKISYYDGKVAGKEAGEGYYHYRVVNPDAQTVDAYSQAITGDSAVDKVYVRTGVLKDGTHDYTFTKPDTTITVEKTLIAGGPWISKISAAVSGGDNHDAYLQMNGNNLTVNTTSDTHTTGITAIGKGVVDLEDAGKVSVSAESTGFGQTAAIFVNGGGTVKVHNGTGDLDSKVLTLRAKGKIRNNVAVIKAMNGIADAQSSIAIDGLVDVLADGKNGSNEAVSIVASKADIGGGSIKAVNGAAYAIRAYGEFNSANRAVVNVNTVKDAEGRITGAGNHRTEVEGNISLGGGMDSGANAEVNLGLNTKDSYFKGDVAYLNASPNGQVNLYMGNGASWTGNNLSGSSVNARITGGASWTGYSSGNNMHLSLQEGALWNNIGSSHISSLAGNQGLIDMSGDKAGTVEAGNYSGNTTVIYRHEIKDNEGKDHASLYGNKEASIMGGDFKITNAAENSTITLLTDNAGVNTASTDYRDQNLVYDLMDKLAGKLYYSGYADGHLKGIVKIAEGLTASSAMMKMGDISFYTDKDEGKTAGEGYYKYDLVYPSEQVVNPMDKVIDGSEDSRNNYRDAGVYHDETESYDFTSKPAEVTASDHDDGVVHAKDNDVEVTTKDWLHVTAKDDGVGMASENGKTVSTEGNTQITAKDGIGVKADKGTVSLKGHTIISAGTGMEAVNGGTISADGTTDMTTGEGKNALHADGDGSTISLKDGTISGAVLAENKGSISTNGTVLKGAATASKEGTIHLDGGSTSEGITADGGTIYTAGTDVKGEALAKAKGTLSMTGGNAGAVTADGGSASTDGTAVKGLLSAKNGGSITMTNGSAKGLSIDKDSAIIAKLDKKDASIQGDIANEGTASLTLGGGASWIGDSTGSGKTNASIGEGSTWTGRSTNGNTTVELAGTWKQTGDSTIASITGRNGTLDKTSETSGDTTIDHAAGTLNLLYSHSAEDPTTFYGGDTTISTADSGTTVNMVTDSRGLTVSGNRARWANYRNQASETLNRMAHKLHYTANDGNIKGTLKIAEGLTSSSAFLRAENLTFDETGTGSYVYDPVKDDLTIEYGSEETQMMKGTKSALLGVSMMWRSNNNDLQRRLGDLRLGQAESGVWARYVGGKNKFDEQNTYMSQTYDIGQVGYDRKAGSWLVGAALDYGKGDVNYTGGKGKEHMATLALYGTRVSDDGKYFDIIFKTGRLKNEFHVSNEIGNRLNADYHTWGNSVSAEYGKRFVRDDGFYLDPSVELTMGRLNSKNFSGHSDLGELNVKQHDFDSAIGRIGLGIGRQTERSNAFLKLALAHEFGGSFKTDFYADDGGLKSTRIDLQDTWLDMEIGGSLSIGRNTYLYGTYTHNFGADMETKWRADVGVRYTF